MRPIFIIINHSKSCYLPWNRLYSATYFVLFFLFLSFFLDCIKIGAVFWGLWSKRNDSINYFRAFISRIDDTWLKFYLEVNPRQTRTYKKTQPVLIIDKVPEKKDVLLGSLVIAVHRNSKTDWYRTGKVEEIGSYWRDGKFRVKFDNGRSRWVPQNQIRLVKRPKFC